MRRDENGEIKGVRLLMFDYTSQCMKTIKVWEKLVSIEFTRLRTLTVEQAQSQGWKGVTNRPKGTIWNDDALTYLKGIGKSTYSKLVAVGLEKISHLRYASNDDLNRYAVMTKLSFTALQNWRTQCNTCTEGSSPYPIPFDYITGQDNAYICRYGEERWEFELSKNPKCNLRGCVCVTTLIRHVDKQTALAYKGTEFEDTYRWYHDALNQMCDTKCMEWMKAEGYWERWITPELGLNAVVRAKDENGMECTSRRYANRPVGDQPELMPHDASLNWDVDCSNNMHVLLTSHLPRDDCRKFSKATPKEITRAISRLCHPTTGVVPKSHRIIEDTNRVLYCLGKIVEAGGAVVPGLVNRNGHRNKQGDGGGRKYFARRTTPCENLGLDHFGIIQEVQDVAEEYFELHKEKFQRFQNLNVEE